MISVLFCCCKGKRITGEKRKTTNFKIGNFFCHLSLQIIERNEQKFKNRKKKNTNKLQNNYYYFSQKILLPLLLEKKKQNK